MVQGRGNGIVGGDEFGSRSEKEEGELDKRVEGD